MDITEYLKRDIEAMRQRLSEIEGQRDQMRAQVERLDKLAEQQRGALVYANGLLEQVAASRSNGDGAAPDGVHVAEASEGAVDDFAG